MRRPPARGSIRRLGLAATLAATLAGAIAACGGSSSPPAPPKPAAPRPTADDVPAANGHHGRQAGVHGGEHRSRPARRPPPRARRLPAAARPPLVGPPAIVKSYIPFGAKRKQETKAYALEHYGIDTYRLTDPHLVIWHYTETSDYQSVFNTFADDVPDVEFHELPQVCAHYVIDTDGTIHQLVPLGIMCRHVVGLNYTAIGIESVGRVRPAGAR